MSDGQGNDVAERLGKFQLSVPDLEATHKQLESVIRHIPLLKTGLADRDLRLKAESLQSLGSFKLRAGVTAAKKAVLEGTEKLITASAGNFAQGLAYGANIAGLPVEVHVPDTAAKSKVAAIRNLGATIKEHPFDDWWAIMQSRKVAGDGKFVHPVSEEEVILGNATIGFEIWKEMPDVEVVIAPFGGGGLSVGIAMALKALGSKAKVVTSEVETSAALAAAFEAGRPVNINRQPSFVDGIGSNSVLNEMWPLITQHIDRSIVVSIDECVAAVKELALQHKLVVEGAGASAYAVAQRPEFVGTKMVAVLSGSNIDVAVLAKIITS